jgi:hypothetical protein
VSEFSLRYLSWKALTDPKYKDTQIAIVVGGGQKGATDLIDRVRGLFDKKLGIWFDTKVTEIILPTNVLIRAYAANNISALRGKHNIVCVLVDEASYINIADHQKIRDAIEPYRSKMDCQILLVSTPQVPGDLLYNIFNEEQDSGYTKLSLDYRHGLGYIFTEDEIREAQRKRSFESEFNLRWASGENSCFHTQDIDAAINTSYSPSDSISRSPTIFRSLGADFGLSSSRTGIVITQHCNGRIQVIYAKEFEKPLMSEMCDTIVDLANYYPNTLCFLDASTIGAVQMCKELVGDHDLRTWSSVKEQHVSDMSMRYPYGVKIVPVVFNSVNTRKMLSDMNDLLVARKIDIHPSFSELILAIKTAKADDTWSLHKHSPNAGKHLDLFDAGRLSLMNWRKRSEIITV